MIKSTFSPFIQEERISAKNDIKKIFFFIEFRKDIRYQNEEQEQMVLAF